MNQKDEELLWQSMEILLRKSLQESPTDNTRSETTIYGTVLMKVLRYENQSN